MKFAAVLTCSLVAVGSAAVIGKSQNFLGNGMQPEVVARTLSSVEEEWKAQASVFARCNGTSTEASSSLVNCADAPTSFDKSCGTVVAAIIQGSGGDRKVANEYMNDVCTQKSISGWHQQQCQALAAAVQNFMTADSYENREHFNTAKLCQSHWVKFTQEEKERMQKEAAEREAAEKNAEEQAALEEKAHNEEVQKEMEAEQAAAKAAAEKEAECKQEEEKKRAELEAQVKAAEAAAKLAQKKAEAEAIAAAAAKKKEEADAAEQENANAIAKLGAVSPAPVSKEENATEVQQKVEPAPVAFTLDSKASNVTMANVSGKVVATNSSMEVNATK